MEPWSSFWERVEKQDEGCWRWHGRHDPNGYGQIRFAGRYYQAHRLAWEWAKGVIGGPLYNQCGNVGCCNPEHWSPHRT